MHFWLPRLSNKTQRAWLAFLPWASFTVCLLLAKGYHQPISLMAHRGNLHRGNRTKCLSFQWHNKQGNCHKAYRMQGEHTPNIIGEDPDYLAELLPNWFFFCCLILFLCHYNSSHHYQPEELCSWLDFITKPTRPQMDGSFGSRGIMSLQHPWLSRVLQMLREN